MHRVQILIALVFCAASSVAAQSVQTLQRQLDAHLTNGPTRGTWGVVVISLTRGDTLYAQGADTPLLPASTMKLYTAAIAFDRFGPAHQFRTEVLRDGPVGPSGVLNGNLYLKGAGDPALSSRYASWSGGIGPMDAIADLVVDAGIRQIRGDVIGDASAFDDRRVPEGWKRRNLQSGYSARVSALSVDENVASIVVRSTARGATAQFSDPMVGVPIHSTVTVREGSRSAYIRVWQDTTADHFRVTGWIGSLSPQRSYRVVVEQPEAFAAASFRAALERRGIVIEGVVHADAAPPQAMRVTAWSSAPVAQLVMTMNGESNNHFAELLFRNAARSLGGVGTADIANESLQQFMTYRVGAAEASVFAADGSGLSTLDRVTARSMAQLLAYAGSASWGEVFKTSLPIAGRTETLSSRMRRTPAQGNLRGKTGTTDDVNSLGGYVTAANGEELVFAFIYNGRSSSRARVAIDAMGVSLAGFTR